MKDKQSKIGIVKSHFLDSGAFSQWALAQKYHQEYGGDKWDYYNTPDFWKYVDDYAAFVKKYQIAIDLYANVDVIPNPELTWRNQRYLEKEHGLRPVPVVHYKTNTKWLRRYMKAGYELIALGGLVGSTMKRSCRDWVDECFDIVCDTPKRLPKVKIHGFGITSYKYLLRYPWWSVDSAAWDKVSSYGGVYIPHKRKGKFVFDTAPYLLKCSMESPERKKRNHFLNISERERRIIKEWFSLINIPVGKLEGEEVKEKGAVTYHVYRRIANLYFFQRFVDSLPSWPWSFQMRQDTLL